MDHLFIEDPRASCLNIEYKDEQYHCMPSAERFSAHTGVCQILGSKSIRGSRCQLAVGDIVRFGSVGVLISEIDTGGTGQSDGSLSSTDISELMQHVVCNDDDELTNCDSGLDTDDEVGDGSSDNDATADEATGAESDVGTTDGGPPICYVCYDEGDDENPLIAPCMCSGDTKYIHVSCLKRWNTGDEKNEICAVFDETNLRKCTICKAPYPAKTKVPSGETVSLLPDKLQAPSITFIVITKHSSANMATNTRYQLSLANLRANHAERPLLVGRSSQCDMILKYRTVSTVHAEVHYHNGEFSVQDIGSSNGTLRYIYKPLRLHVGQPVHLKFGRTVVSLKAKRRLRLASLFSSFSTSCNTSEQPKPPPAVTEL